MKKSKTFFDNDITINEKLFDNFNVNSIASWSHLELWCTIQNVEIDYEFFKGILCGTAVFKNLYDIILDALKTTNFIDKFLAKTEVIEIIEKLFDNSKLGQTYDGKEFWIELAFKQAETTAFNDYMESGISADTEKKYKLLNAIFSKNPFIILKFYDKTKLAIHIRDTNFEVWLLNKCKNLAAKQPLFANIYSALCAEVKKQRTISMYLN